MAPVIFIVALVALPIVVGTCLTYAISKFYKRRQQPPPDVERARSFERTGQNDDHSSIHMQDFEQPGRAHGSFQRHRPNDIVPANVAPVTKPLPSLYVGTIGGEGLVSRPEPCKTSEGRPWKGKESTGIDDGFQQEDLYALNPWEWQREEMEQPGLHTEYQQIGLVAPKPVRAVTNIAGLQPTNALYDVRTTKCADIWKDINNRTCPKKDAERPPLEERTVPREVHEDEFEDVDLGRDSEECRQTKHPAAPVVKLLSRPESNDDSIAVENASNGDFEESQQFVHRAELEQEEKTPVEERTQANSPNEAPFYGVKSQQRYAEAKNGAEGKQETAKEEHRDVAGDVLAPDPKDAESSTDSLYASPTSPVRPPGLAEGPASDEENHKHPLLVTEDDYPAETRREDNDEPRAAADKQRKTDDQDDSSSWSERWMQMVTDAETRGANTGSNTGIDEYQEVAVGYRPSSGEPRGFLCTTRKDRSFRPPRSSYGSSYASDKSSRPSSGDAPQSSHASGNTSRAGFEEPRRSSYHTNHSYASSDGSKADWRPASHTSTDSGQSKHSENKPPPGKPSLAQRVASKLGRKSSDKTWKSPTDDLRRTSLENAAVMQEQQRTSADSMHSWEQSRQSSATSRRSWEDRGQVVEKTRDSGKFGKVTEDKVQAHWRQPERLRQAEDSRKREERRKSMAALTGIDYPSSDDEA